MLCVWLFSSNLGLCIYELSLFLWLSAAYCLIVYGAELNQQTLRQNTSELKDKRAQLQTRCLFFCTYLSGLGEEEKMMKRKGGEERICLLIVLEEADAHPERS